MIRIHDPWRGSLRACAVTFVFLALAGPAVADTMSYPGANTYVRGRYFESAGRFEEAKAAYLGIVESQPSEKAVREALDRLVRLAQASGNLQEEIGYLELAVTAGRLGAINRLAEIETSTGLAPPSFDLIAPLYEQQALATDSTSVPLLLATLAERGRLSGVGIENTDAGFWYELAAQRGSKSALIKTLDRAVASGQDDIARSILARFPPSEQGRRALSYGKSLAVGENGLKPDRVRAEAWLAFAPPAEVQAAYGSFMRKAASSGKGDEALYWYGKLANVDGAATSGTLGKLYAAATSADAKAKILGSLESAARRGDVAAARTATKILTDTKGGDDPATMDMLAIAAAGGDDKAVETLSRTAATLPEGEPMADVALSSLRKAASKGSVPAMLSLARFYGSGGPVAPDAAESLDWYGKAAKAGDPESQFRLGLAHQTGAGVEKDPELARTWLARAAKQGYGPAESALASVQ